MYRHGEAGRFACLRIQFCTTRADQNPKQMWLHASVCFFCKSDWCRRWHYISELGLFQLQHECSHSYMSLHTVTVNIETKKDRVNTSIFIYAFSIHPFWHKQTPVKPLGNCLSSSNGGSWFYLDKSSPQPRGRAAPKTLINIPPAAQLMQALFVYWRHTYEKKGRQTQPKYVEIQRNFSVRINSREPLSSNCPHYDYLECEHWQGVSESWKATPRKVEQTFFIHPPGLTPFFCLGGVGTTARIIFASLLRWK